MWHISFREITQHTPSCLLKNVGGVPIVSTPEQEKPASLSDSELIDGGYVILRMSLSWWNLVQINMAGARGMLDSLKGD